MNVGSRRRPNPEQGLREQVAALERKVDHFMSSTQAQVDALTAAVSAVNTDLGNAVTNIQAEIAALQQANPALDLTGLTDAVSALQGVQASVDALETPASS